MINKIEVISRTLLWVTLSCVLVLCFGVVPLKLSNIYQQSAKNDIRVQELKKEIQELQKPPEVELLSIESFKLKDIFGRSSGTLEKSFSSFVNPTNRSGPVCVIGEVIDNDGKVLVHSEPGCYQFQPFSTVTMTFDFFPPKDGIDSINCQEVGCNLRVRDLKIEPKNPK